MEKRIKVRQEKDGELVWDDGEEKKKYQHYDRRLKTDMERLWKWSKVIWKDKWEEQIKQMFEQKSETILRENERERKGYKGIAERLKN